MIPPGVCSWVGLGYVGCDGSYECRTWIAGAFWVRLGARRREACVRACWGTPLGRCRCRPLLPPVARRLPPAADQARVWAPPSDRRAPLRPSSTSWGTTCFWTTPPPPATRTVTCPVPWAPAATTAASTPRTPSSWAGSRCATCGGWDCRASGAVECCTLALPAWPPLHTMTHQTTPLQALTVDNVNLPANGLPVYFSIYSQSVCAVWRGGGGGRLPGERLHDGAAAGRGCRPRPTCPTHTHPWATHPHFR